MTLNAGDIAKMQKLYSQLDELHAFRRQIKDAVFASMEARIQRGTSGVEYITFRQTSAEALQEIRDVLARDIRRRAAKVVESLHKLGCEATLTED